MLYVHCRHAPLQQLAKHGRAGCRSLRGPILSSFPAGHYFILGGFHLPGCLCGVVGMFPTLHVNSPGLALTAYSCQVVTFALPQGNFLMPEDFCAKWFLITWPRTFPFCNSMAPCSYPPGKLGMFQALFRIRYHCAAPLVIFYVPIL